MESSDSVRCCVRAKLRVTRRMGGKTNLIWGRVLVCMPNGRKKGSIESCSSTPPCCMFCRNIANINILIDSVVPKARIELKLKHSSDLVPDLPTEITGTASPWRARGIALRFQPGRFRIGWFSNLGSCRVSTSVQNSSNRAAGSLHRPKNL